MQRLYLQFCKKQGSFTRLPNYVRQNLDHCYIFFFIIFIQLNHFQFLSYISSLTLPMDQISSELSQNTKQLFFLFKSQTEVKFHSIAYFITWLMSPLVIHFVFWPCTTHHWHFYLPKKNVYIKCLTFMTILWFHLSDLLLLLKQDITVLHLLLSSTPNDQEHQLFVHILVWKNI